MNGHSFLLTKLSFLSSWCSLNHPLAILLHDFFTARGYNHKGEGQLVLPPDPLWFPRILNQEWWGLTIYAFYKMSYFPLSFHILQKTLSFLSVPTIWEKKKSKKKKKVAEGWFPTPPQHLKWGSDAFSEMCPGTVLRIAGRKGLTPGNSLHLHLEI